MRASVWGVTAIVAIQAALIGTYWLVEHARDDGRSELSTAPPDPVSGPLPPLSLERRDGRRFELRMRERPTLLHFWATWCPPCRTELPGLLALSDEHPIDVVAVALDREWADVEAFLDADDHPNVFLGDSDEVEKAFGVRSLPVTILVDPGARLRLRFEGARDWTDPGFLETWVRAG